MFDNEESPAMTRCWLVSWSTLDGASYHEATSGRFEPSLGIDVNEDAISVIDIKTNAVIASAPPAQVTATPAKYERSYPRFGLIALPVLVVNVPGARQLTIGCMEPKQGFAAGYHFSWNGAVAAEKEPAYVAAGPSWLTLVDAFGLAPRAEGSRPVRTSPDMSDSLYSQPRRTRLMRRVMIGWLAVWLVFALIVLVLGVAFHQF
jgi:hypothetical protein